ncbi:MAG TPA: hypothetical protein VMW16_09350 [Sedimentisphaerales bacterium]|nr:hypothetical protein [Sedimentisphaerales bacterium]
MLSVKTVGFAEYLASLDGCEDLVEFENVSHFRKDTHETPVAVNIFGFLSRQCLTGIDLYLGVRDNNQQGYDMLVPQVCLPVSYVFSV